MYRERKSVTPAKTVTRSHLLYMKNARCKSPNLNTEQTPQGQAHYNKG